MCDNSYIGRFDNPSVMNAIVTLIIGVIAAWSARSTFPTMRWLGVAGTLTLGISGSMVGALISVVQYGPDHMMGFSPMHIWWSTLGAVVVLAASVVVRRAEHASARADLNQT